MAGLSDVWQSTIDFFETPEIYEFVLPFLLVTVLIFAILEKIKIFGRDGKKFNIIISVVIGILLARQGDLVQFINQYLPNVSAVIIVFLGFLLLLGLFKKGDSPLSGGIVFVFVIIAVIGGSWALIQAAQGQDEINIPLIDLEITAEDAGVMLGIGLVFIILAVAFGYKKKNTGHFQGLLEGMKDIGNSFQK